MYKGNYLRTAPKNNSIPGLSFVVRFYDLGAKIPCLAGLELVWVQRDLHLHNKESHVLMM